MNTPSNQQSTHPNNRHDGRSPADLRPISFERDFTQMAPGSVLVSFGKTRVLCTASVEDDIPRWLRDQQQGWVTAEYSLLPGSSPTRVRREADAGRFTGRTMEIQRLISRSLRAVVDLPALGERKVTLDCDVLQADGGTRTAAISGAYVALHDAFERLKLERKLKANPITSEVAAVSVGMVSLNINNTSKNTPLLDLDYHEDSRAEVDMNVVMNGEGNFLEVQGTAEGQAFSASELNDMLELARGGIQQIISAQKELTSTPLPKRD